MKDKKKRILVDIGHPAHVHLFRNAINEWRSRGHSVVITIRDKDITARLLDAYGFSYSIASKARNGFIGLAFEMVEHDIGVLKAAIKNRSKILIGTSVAITHVAPLIGAKSILFSEDDASVAKTFVRLSYPFASKIVTPTTLGENHGRKHIQYEGYQKLAYLNPKYFTPDPTIKEKLGIRHDEPYFLMRFVTLKAAHDVGEFGMDVDLQRELVTFLEKFGKVFITSERKLADDLEKYRFNLNPSEIHHALNYAKIFIGDSQSMAVEASILGVPSVRINSFADRCSILQELQKKYELSYAFFPSQRNEIFILLKNWLENDQLGEDWNKKRAKLLEDKIDVTEWMVEFVENL